MVIPLLVESIELPSQTNFCLKLSFWAMSHIERKRNLKSPFMFLQYLICVPFCLIDLFFLTRFEQEWQELQAKVGELS